MRSRITLAYGLSNLIWIAVGVLWIAASCGGMVMLANYANSESPAHQAPRQWPSESSIRLSETGATLVLFAHPRCPCTRASLGELEKIIARFQGDVTPWIVFFKPPGANEEWDQTDLETKALGMHSVRVLSDPNAIEANRFHATTSGETLLYNNEGELLFQGGITMARGHAGDNSGRSAIEACLSDREPLCRQTAVFGCPIAIPLEQK